MASRAAARARSASRQARKAVAVAVRRRLQPAEGIEQPGMGGGIGQADLVVLALHLDQRRRQAAQQPDRDRLAVDEGAAAAIGLDHAAEHQRILRLHALLGEDGQRRMALRRHEAGGDRALRLAGADHAGLGPQAAGQAQAVEQDGLAGAGLAGQHGQAGAEGQVQPFDQHDVADRERGEHAGAPGLA